MTDLLEVAPHEFDENLIYEYDDGDPDHESGLRPFYAVEAIVRQHDGSKRAKFEWNGETYYVTLKYEDSGIGALNHPTCDLDTIREYRVLWERDDAVGECSGSFHIAPRTPQMADEDGGSITTPPDLVGVNVRAQGSNFPFLQYPELLQRCMISLGVSRRYWREKHLHTERLSNVTDAACYVRITDEASGRLHAVDGALSRISRLLDADRKGYRKRVADDTECPGYYHTATIGPHRAAELVDRHHYPKEVKHYYPRDPDSFSEDHPLAHPKLEVSLQTSRTDETIYHADLERLVRELEEALLNVLQWEDYPVTAEELADGHPYVTSDIYFDVEASHRNRRLLADPTPQLKDQQESLVIKHLTEGLEDSDYALLDVAVSDGGSLSPEAIADETGFHIDTIYTAIDRLGDLIEHSYGELSLRSHYVAERVTTAVQEWKERGEAVLETAAEALEHGEAFERANDALTEWASRHGIEINDRDDARLGLRAGQFDSRSEIRHVLQQGLHLWRRAGWKVEVFKDARVDAQVDGYHEVGRARSFLGL